MPSPLADIETGGGYFPIEERDLQRDVSAAFGRILDELRHQYVIGIDARSGTDGEVTVRSGPRPLVVC
jgi:hypothetical protein